MDLPELSNKMDRIPVEMAMEIETRKSGQFYSANMNGKALFKRAPSNSTTASRLPPNKLEITRHDPALLLLG